MIKRLYNLLSRGALSEESYPVIERRTMYTGSALVNEEASMLMRRLLKMSDQDLLQELQKATGEKALASDLERCRDVLESCIATRGKTRAYIELIKEIRDR